MHIKPYKAMFFPIFIFLPYEPKIGSKRKT